MVSDALLPPHFTSVKRQEGDKYKADEKRWTRERERESVCVYVRARERERQELLDGPGASMENRGRLDDSRRGGLTCACE
jgi:hypothetical protein